MTTPGAMTKYAPPEDLTHLPHLEHTAFILHHSRTWSSATPCEAGLIVPFSQVSKLALREMKQRMKIAQLGCQDLNSVSYVFWSLHFHCFGVTIVLES